MIVLQSDRLLEKLNSAFHGVTRDGGISWLQADVIDDYGSAWDHECALANETDYSWMDVALDPDWKIDDYQSNWSFLDAIGFRYYLAAAMARHLVRGQEVLEDFTLGSPRNTGFDVFSKKQIEAIIAYMEFCIDERALQELESKLDQEGITYEEYFESNEGFDIELFDNSWQDTRNQWKEYLNEIASEVDEDQFRETALPPNS